MECKKSDTRGYPKKISVSSYESEVMGKIQKNYDLSYSEERFERPIKRSYKISVQESYRENGKVKKRGSSICTIKYYDLAEGYFNLTDWAESAIIKAAEKFNVTVDKIYEVIETKLDKLEAEVQAEFHKTEEYLTYEKNKEIVTSYRSKKKRFNEKYGTADVKMYQSKKTPNVTRKATLNNLAKLYIIASQFDLTAKKEEDESYIRTFYDDILMTGKLEQIVLNDTAKTDAKTPADNTGYYVRPKTIETDDLTEKQKCYYLWNPLTFYPEADEMDALWSTDSQCNINVDKFVSYGYNRSYFDVNDASNIFTSSKMGMKAKGSDGEHGNVAIPQNANNENYSTLLGNTENADVLNVAMDTAFQIMNNRPETVNNLVVKALKQAKKYVKLADDSVLIDYSSDRSYTSETSYLKVQIHDNNNTEDGLVTKISLKNESGETAPGSNLILYTTKDMTTACEKTTYSGKTGYQVKTSAPLIAYIPYSIKDWAKGYNIIEFETVGRTYSERKKKTIMGSPVTSQITIGERTLFSLE